MKASPREMDKEIGRGEIVRRVQDNQEAKTNVCYVTPARRAVLQQARTRAADVRKCRVVLFESGLQWQDGARC